MRYVLVPVNEALLKDIIVIVIKVVKYLSTANSLFFAQRLGIVSTNTLHHALFYSENSSLGTNFCVGQKRIQMLMTMDNMSICAAFRREQNTVHGRRQCPSPP